MPLSHSFVTLWLVHTWPKLGILTGKQQPDIPQVLGTRGHPQPSSLKLAGQLYLPHLRPLLLDPPGTSQNHPHAFTEGSPSTWVTLPLSPLSSTLARLCGFSLHLSSGAPPCPRPPLPCFPGAAQESSLISLAMWCGQWCGLCDCPSLAPWLPAWCLATMAQGFNKKCLH